MKASSLNLIIFVALILAIVPASVQGQTAKEIPTPSDTPVMPAEVPVLALLTGIQAITAGANHTCALTTDGGVKCWGWDVEGQVGDGADNDDKLTPVDVVGLTSGITAIAAGYSHTCALTTGGGVKCWGRDNNGQVGDGADNSDKLTPVDVTGLTSGVTAIAAGGLHTCALTTGGGVKCWGRDANGQVGDGADNSDKLTPVDVVGLTSGIQAITAGAYHTCALTTSGGVKCWGWDAEGQVGDGADNSDKLTPVDVVGLTSGVQAIDAGVAHTCALTTGGGVKCWGRDAEGQVGDGADNSDKLTPVDVLGLSSGVTAIDAGWYHTCALTSGGGVKCWGGDSDGQVGDGSDNTDKLTPVDVLGLTNGVQAVSTGGAHTCALTTGGGVKCWGLDSNGQVGDGALATDKLLPVDVLVPATCYQLTPGHSGQGTSPVADPKRTPGCPLDHYLPGQNIALYANAANNWRVNGWTGTKNNASLVDVNSLIMPAQDRTVSVTYARCRTLTVTHSGSGGDPVPAPENSFNCPLGTYMSGQTIAFFAKPNADQRVKRWNGADTTPATGALVNTLTMPNSAHTVEAVYEACNVLTAQVSGQGDPISAAPLASVGCSAGSYASGQSIVLTAAPASGWTIEGWKGTADDDSANATNSIIMPDDDHIVGVTYTELANEEPGPEASIFLPDLQK